MPRRSTLSPAELAEAAVLADLAALMVVIARLTPLAGMTTVLGSVPFAVLAMRNRAATVVTAFWLTAILVFLLAGFGAATQVVVMALFGSIVGRALAGGWSRTRVVLVAVAIGWTTVAALTLGFLTVFSNLRQLNLDLARVQWDGLARIMRSAELTSAADIGDTILDWSIENWWLAVPAFQLIISVLLVLFVLRVARPVVQRVMRSLSPRPDPPDELSSLADGVLARSGLTVVVGDNGAGKSTLLRVLADNRGDLGRRGGTAMVGQRPESQVIGARVIDDLCWGIEPRPTEAEAEAALERVGLGGKAEQESGSLSGGELQRLALAGALLREPELVLSDESTAMIDPAGRETVMAVLRTLADDGVDVVHVTHIEAERSLADHLVEL